jgi:hypothetical protein
MMHLRSEPVLDRIIAQDRRMAELGAPAEQKARSST